MRYQLSGLVFASDTPLPELDSRPGAHMPEVTVHWAADPPPASTAFFEWRTPSGGHWLTFGRAADGAFVLSFTTFAAFRVSRDGGRVDVYPRAGTPPATVRHLLLNQVLPLVLSQRGRLVLHASAVSIGGRVAAFVGRSGAGKSTLAAAVAVAGGAIVADDCLVLHRGPSGWLATPCGAGMRLWPRTLELLGWPATSGAGMAHFSEKRRVGARHAGDHPGLAFERAVKPLAAIFALGRPDDETGGGEARGLGGRAAVLALASEVFRLDPTDLAASRAHFDAVTALASEVPLVALARRAPALAAGDVCVEWPIMTSERPDDTRRAPSTEPTASRRQWHRPTLTAYGPIGKLTQGGTGGRNDGSTGKRA